VIVLKQADFFLPRSSYPTRDYETSSQ